MLETSIGFTGDQLGCTELQKKTLARVLGSLYWEFGFREFHEGDCIGADTEAFGYARALGYWIGVHPPMNESKACGRTGNFRFEPKPYLARDRDIVDASSILVACPGSYEEIIRSGTWATIRYARKVYKPIIKIFPDGTTKTELADRLEEMIQHARSFNR